MAAMNQVSGLQVTQSPSTLHASPWTPTVASFHGRMSASVGSQYCRCVLIGTSACTAGTFYCRNRGHQPLTLNSSFVDDNICGESDSTPRLPCRAVKRPVCMPSGTQVAITLMFVSYCLPSRHRPADCCDGSDEAPGVCKNTCVEKGAAAREALRTAAKQAGAGNKVGKQRVTSGCLLTGFMECRTDARRMCLHSST